MFEVEDRKNDKCEKHGDYVNEYVDYGPMGKRWSGCRKCADEARELKLEQERHEEDEQRRKDRLNSLLRKAGIPKKFDSKTFENFEPVNDKAAARKKALREYSEVVQSNEHNGKSLIMVGKLGNGKTHLACALIQDVIIGSGKTGRYTTFSEIVRRVKSSWRRNAEESEDGVYRDLSWPHLLVIDEVGMQNFTEFEQTVAYEVINARYLDEKPTVVVTNLQAKELSSTIGERAVDRLRENGGKALDFDWESYRAGTK